MILFLSNIGCLQEYNRVTTGLENFLNLLVHKLLDLRVSYKL